MIWNIEWKNCAFELPDLLKLRSSRTSYQRAKMAVVDFILNASKLVYETKKNKCFVCICCC